MLKRDITHVTRETQERIFRVCQDRGLTLAAISAESGVPLSTLRTYAGLNGATAVMGVDKLYMLIGIVPDELLSLLLPPLRAIVRVPDGLDHDEIEKAARDFLACKGEAHHPDSPGGREISDCEHAALTGRAVRLRAVA